MRPPERHVLIERLSAFVQEHDIQPDPAFAGHHSGVYAVLNCVYSSRAHFNSVIRTLKSFDDNSGLQDVESLTFSEFTHQLDHGLSERPSAKTFERYAREVPENLTRLAGRLKIEVAYDVCRLFIGLELETAAHLRALKGTPGDRIKPRVPGKLDCLVLQGMALGTTTPPKIRGMGMALAPYLLILLGLEEYIKLDTHIGNLLEREWGWRPNPYKAADFALVLDVMGVVAREQDTTAARLDNALWSYERERAKGSGRRQSVQSIIQG